MNLKKLLMRTTDKLKLALGKYGVGVTNTVEVINNTYNALYVFHKGTRETSFNIKLLFTLTAVYKIGPEQVRELRQMCEYLACSENKPDLDINRMNIKYYVHNGTWEFNSNGDTPKKLRCSYNPFIKQYHVAVDITLDCVDKLRRHDPDYCKLFNISEDIYINVRSIVNILKYKETQYASINVFKIWDNTSARSELHYTELLKNVVNETQSPYSTFYDYITIVRKLLGIKGIDHIQIWNYEPVGYAWLMLTFTCMSDRYTLLYSHNNSKQIVIYNNATGAMMTFTQSYSVQLMFASISHFIHMYIPTQQP